MEINTKYENYPTAGRQPETFEVKLLVLGLKETEHQFLSFIVRSSRISRRPHIVLLDEADGKDADVVLIDLADEYAKKWVGDKSWLHSKVVISVDGETVHGGTAVQRPIKWAYLPTLLAKLREQSKSISVLVVDDSLAVRAQVRSLLESRGLLVTDVENADTAIKLAAATRYACILMDVLMPGMDGYEACRRIKENAQFGLQSTVVMLTSKSSPFDRIKGMMAGCDAYLTKPINPEKLQHVISHYVEKPA